MTCRTFDNNSIDSFSADDNIIPSNVDSVRTSCYVKPTVASEDQKNPIETKSLKHKSRYSKAVDRLSTDQG